MNPSHILSVSGVCVCVCARVMAGKMHQNSSSLHLNLSAEYCHSTQALTAHGSLVCIIDPTHYRNQIYDFCSVKGQWTNKKKIANICWTRYRCLHSALTFRERAADANIYFPSNEVECAFIARRALNQSHRNFHHDIASIHCHTIYKR